jgi:hypothetical protein
MKNWKGFKKIEWRSDLVTVLAFAKGAQENNKNPVSVWSSIEPRTSKIQL